MRHARDEDLDALEPLLARLRGIPGLVERKRGVFYLRSKAFLHFRQDPAGMFADISTDDGLTFDRLQVDAPSGQDDLVKTAAVRAKG
jgi:hypothetical protein